MKKVRFFLLTVLCLTFVATLFASCITEEPGVTGEPSIVAEIIGAYYSQASEAFQCQYPIVSLSLRFRGAFSDTYVVFIDGPFAYLVAVTTESVGGITFTYPDSRKMTAYHQGSFYSLGEAYDLGLLTMDDLVQLKETYVAFGDGYFEKGDVPTSREPCTHPPVPPTEPPAPTETTAPTESPAPTEPIAPTEPVDWNVLLPDIPAATDPCEKPETLTAETLVYTVYDYTFSWTDRWDKEQTFTIQLPAILPFCDGAIEINEAIRSLFKYTIDYVRHSYEMESTCTTKSIYYTASLTDHFLSIRTFETSTYSSTTERFWILDISTGKCSKTPELAQTLLQESYPVFLHHCTNNLIEYFTANPLDNPEQQSMLIQSLTNERAFLSGYILYLDPNGTLMLDVESIVGTIKGLEYNAINRGNWDYTEQDSYRWLFYLKADGEAAEKLCQDLKASFFQDPHTFVKMLSQEYSGTIEHIARELNYSLYSLEEIERYKELCEDVYILSEDKTIRKTAQTLLAFANTLSLPPC